MTPDELRAEREASLARQRAADEEHTRLYGTPIPRRRPNTIVVGAQLYSRNGVPFKPAREFDA